MNLGVTLREAAAGAATSTSGGTPLWPGHQPGYIYLGTAEPGTSTTQDTVNLIGHDLGLEREYFNDYNSEAAEDAFIQGALSRNRIPWISYRVSNVSSEVTDDWAAIAAGTNDAEHSARGVRYAAFGRPIIITWNGQPDLDNPTGTGDFYRTAWLRIYNLFQAAGATNVAFVPNITDDVWFGGTPTKWLDTSIMNAMGFLGVRSDKTTANDTFASRLPTILAWLDGQGFATKMLGVGRCNGYTSSGQTGAAWWTTSWNYAFAHTDRIGAISYHNSDSTPPPTGSDLISESQAKINAFATSASNSVTLVPVSPTAPAAPVITAGAPTNTSIPITWPAPAAPSIAPLQGFNVFSQVGATGTPVLVQTLAATARSYTYSNLIQGTAYTLWINAFNSGGSSPDSNRITTSTSGGTVPGAPTAPVASNITNTSAQLDWTAPTSPNAITSYKVYDGTTLVRTVVGTPLPTNTVVSGLLAGSIHHYSVSATNQSGEGPKSPQTTVTISGTGAYSLKPRVGGLVVTSGPAATNGINHILFRLQWSDLEPVAQGVYDWTTATTALNSLPPGAYAKFGVQAGGHSPTWLKSLTGTVSVLNTKDSVTAVCPRWWDSRMQTAWANLQLAMAAQFDADPRLKQVIACEAMTVYMEPFILGGDATSDQNLFTAGLNASVQATAISTMLTNTLNAWTTTRVELPLHTVWEVPQSTGVLNQPWSTLRDFINPFATQYGERLIFTDYGLGPTDTAPSTANMTLATASSEYAWMSLRGNGNQGPVGFQITFGTASANSTNTLATIQNALNMGGCYLEHSSYNALLSASQMTTADGQFKTIAGI